MSWIKDLSLIQFDKDEYLRHLDNYMQDTTKDAARSWLAIVTGIIPVWSRASIATFNELAEAVGFALSFGTLRAREDRTLLGMGTSRGGVRFKKGQWGFYYETDLRYLAYNDLNEAVYGVAPNVFSRNGIPNTPYKFTEAGQNDFNTFAQNVLLPNPYEYLHGEPLI